MGLRFLEPAPTPLLQVVLGSNSPRPPPPFRTTACRGCMSLVSHCLSPECCIMSALAFHSLTNRARAISGQWTAASSSQKIWKMTLVGWGLITGPCCPAHDHHHQQLLRTTNCRQRLEPKRLPLNHPQPRTPHYPSTNH